MRVAGGVKGRELQCGRDGLGGGLVVLFLLGGERDGRWTLGVRQ